MSVLTAVEIDKLSTRKCAYSGYCLINFAGNPKDEYTVNSAALELNRVGNSVKQIANIFYSNEVFLLASAHCCRSSSNRKEQ